MSKVRKDGSVVMSAGERQAVATFMRELEADNAQLLKFIQRQEAYIDALEALLIERQFPQRGQRPRRVK